MHRFQRCCNLFKMHLEILVGWGGDIFLSTNGNFGEVGGGSEIPSVVGVWIFSGNTQCCSLL